eukprot:9873521-Heterocapsa_arctica.AAC.1
MAAWCRHVRNRSGRTSRPCPPPPSPSHGPRCRSTPGHAPEGATRPHPLARSCRAERLLLGAPPC